MRLAALGRCTTHWASVGLDVQGIRDHVATPANVATNQLPLKPVLRPATLQDGADTTEIEQRFASVAATGLLDDLDTDQDLSAKLQAVLRADVFAAL
jgi:hypothetical protein